MCAASVLTEVVGSNYATLPNIWPAWKLSISYIRGKKKSVVIKRCFYRVTVMNVKHRDKFCFPNWCSLGLFFFSTFLTHWFVSVWGVSCKLWDMKLCSSSNTFKICNMHWYDGYYFYLACSLVSLFCIISFHKTTVMKSLNGKPFSCTFSFSEKDI